MLGINIKTARIERGLTQYELAKLCEVAQPTVSDWESNNHEPSISTLSIIAKHTKWSVAELINGKAA